MFELLLAYKCSQISIARYPLDCKKPAMSSCLIGDHELMMLYSTANKTFLICMYPKVCSYACLLVYVTNNMFQVFIVACDLIYVTCLNYLWTLTSCLNRPGVKFLAVRMPKSRDLYAG